MPDNAGRLWRGAIRILINFFFNNFFEAMYGFELINKWKHLTTLELCPDHSDDRDGSCCFRLNSWQIRSKINFSGDIIWSYWVWYTMIMKYAWYIRILRSDTPHSMCIIFTYYYWVVTYILSRAFIPFWSRGVGERGTTGKMSTNKWKVWARFKLMMIMIMIMIIPLIQNNHTGPDILLKKTIQDVLNATLRFWFNLSNTPHTFCIDIERKEREKKGRVIFSAI